MNHQDEKPIIYLIGARGAGKTTVGKPLAQALLYDFIDTDLTTGGTIGLAQFP